MSPSHRLVRVAVPAPIHADFDYLWPGPGSPPAVGCRVRVPFGRSQRVGVVVEHPREARVDRAALKPVSAALDDEPILDRELMATLAWCASYYHHPPGEVLLHALPAMLRRGAAARATAAHVVLTAAGRDADLAALAGRAPRQAEALELLRPSGAVPRTRLTGSGISADTIRRLVDRQLVAIEDRPAAMAPPTPAAEAAPTSATRPELTADQADAVAAVGESRGRFGVFLLYGVTGSGKTEVFLRLIETELAAGRQTLLLVPEISLTPQLVTRLTSRFGAVLAVLHSGLADGDRLRAWQAASAGTATLIVGTRSAVFCPLPNPGLIIVDEEHDPSFKQQSGLRYSARDLAVVRGRALSVPVLLASATPSLETIHNAREGRYRELRLPTRIGAAGVPRMLIVDMNHHAERHGLSTPLLRHLERHLGRGNQVMLFINRRGFAPVLFCPGCEIVVDCPRCDAHLTVHARAAALRCHHCGREERLVWACPTCGSERLALGEGTQRITDELAAVFPGETIARLDRDALVRRDSLGSILEQIESGAARIIVGTQLLAKGHDFPGVTLVGVLNADQGLFGTDFRSEERLAQMLVQVAGRAGRRDRPGDVLIQTHFPGHPLLNGLLEQDYAAFADGALSERRLAGWPPYSRIAVWRADATDRTAARRFLTMLRQAAAADEQPVTVLGPTAHPLERIAGRYRYQLLFQSTDRRALHALIDRCIAALGDWPETRRVRWAIDVDPIEL